MSIDPRSGYSPATKTFHSLRPAVPFPPVSQPLSITAYAVSLLPNRLPSHPAFIDPSTGVSLSYPDLVSQIHSLASSLRSHLGISKGHVAFILCPSCLEIPVLYLALLSLGAIISPANPASTPSELSRLIDVAGPTHFFATSSSSPKLPRHVTPILIDSHEFRSFLESGSPLKDPIEIRQSDPAAIFFSSGTTGHAKGVLLSHRNIITETIPFISILRLQDRPHPTVHMLTAPPFHVYGMVFLIKSVVVGETTVIRTERFDPEKMIGAIERFGVTHLALSPPALLAMVRVCEQVGDRKSGLGSLEVVICGGAPSPPVLIRRFNGLFPNVAFQQGYGLTECTGGVFRCLGLEENSRVGSCGRLIAHCEAKVVDPESGVALPPGKPGELWIRGPTIMAGYVGDSEATAAVLDSEGWLKTGDLCYIDEDGYLFVVDRLKELIKCKGYQVPPAELEQLLQEHPDITEAAVVPYPDEEAGQIPMAFIVRQSHSTLSEAQVMDFINKQVVHYKKIRRVKFVNFIPRNASGKILRRDLIKLATSTLSSKL
ncbi:Acyl-CoA synthetase protein [Dioscorea alata]|uniref:Acyl-CoA synthetase protein n=1 Tax=Dioscorea alata TaxID=55571 RepID=A0ACB7W0C2_DIOAL|nr:Acyl-CoA synthetase protein [Dioscorea alata]